MKRTKEHSIISALNESIEKDKANKVEDNFDIELKGSLAKEFGSVYSFFDNDSSVKVVFNEAEIEKYLSDQSPKLSIDDLNNYQVILKSFSFDYLLYQKEKNIDFKIVCYVHQIELGFQLDEIQPIPDSINNNNEIYQNAEEGFNKAIKEIVKEKFSRGQNGLTAKNFIYNNCPSSYSEENIIDIVREVTKVKNKFVLLKSKVGVDDMNYLLDDNQTKVEYALKDLNWKTLYESMPSLVNRGDSFQGNQKFLPTLVHAITYSEMKPVIRTVIKPSQMEINRKVDEKSIKGFLSRKKKRLNRSEEFKKNFPKSIDGLINMYGDVLVNINHADVGKFNKYKKYSLISE